MRFSHCFHTRAIVLVKAGWRRMITAINCVINRDSYAELNNVSLQPYRKSTLVNHAASIVKRRPIVWLPPLLFAFVIFVFICFLSTLWQSKWFLLLYGVTCGASGILIGFWVYMKQTHLTRQLLAKVCLHHGIRPSGCLICGYNLNGIQSLNCPECGQPLAGKRVEPRFDEHSESCQEP